MILGRPLDQLASGGGVVTAFFVPTERPSSPKEQEGLYQALAEFCGLEPPSPEHRVLRVTWVHDGEEWIAEVGQALRGRRTNRKRRAGRRVDVTVPLSDPAQVLAIFPGDPTWVVTNAPPVGSSRSRWANPFLAGVPRSSQRFASS